MPDQPVRRALPWWAGVHAAPRLAVGVLVLGVLAGVGAGAVQPRTWSASASVLVGVGLTGSQDQSVRASQLVNMETEVEVVRSRQVLDAAADALGAEPGALVGDVSVEVPPGTQVLEITAQASSSEASQRRATAVANAYLDQRRAEAAAQLDRERDAAGARVESLTDQLRSARSEQGAAAEGSTERLLLDSQVDALTSVLTDERARLYGVEGSAPTPGSLLGAPTQAVQGGFAPPLLVAAGALGGLVGAVVLTWLLLALSSAVRSAPQLGSLGVPARRLAARSTGPIQLARPAALRQRVVDGARLQVARVEGGPLPQEVAARVAEGLRLPDGWAGAVLASPSPLEAAEPTSEDGDLVVLLAVRGTPVVEVEQAIEVVVRRGGEVVGLLLVDEADAQAAPAAAAAPAGPTASAARDAEVNRSDDAPRPDEDPAAAAPAKPSGGGKQKGRPPGADPSPGAHGKQPVPADRGRTR